MSSAADFFRQVATALDQMEERPHGPEVEDDERSLAGQACVQLCNGDHDQGRSLWKEVAHHCGGYMPRAAALALVQAAKAGTLMPDVQVPELT